MSIVELYLAQLKKQYPIYLSRLVLGEQFHPITLRGGKSKPDNAVDLHNAIKHFQKLERSNETSGWKVEWEDWSSKRLGKQRWPKHVQIISEVDFLFLLDKQQEVEKFRHQLHKLLEWQPLLRQWIAVRPFLILEHMDSWSGIEKAVDYFLANNVEGDYLRALPIQVHTKFIEGLKNVIYSILRFLEPKRFGDAKKDFEDALGLRRKPYFFRVRWLDKAKAIELTSGMEILALPYDLLRQQQWNIERVIMVENETNLYLIPKATSTLAIFTSGKALHLLNEIRFLEQAEIFYWGDMDEDGFEMLHSIRDYYPNVKSIFMDYHTVEEHKKELDEKRFRKDRKILTLLPSEQAAYEYLAGSDQWLEQEKLRQSFLQCELKKVLGW